MGESFLAIVMLLDLALLGAYAHLSLNPGYNATYTDVISITSRVITGIYTFELLGRFVAFGSRFCLTNNFIRLDLLLVSSDYMDILLRDAMASSDDGGMRSLQFLKNLRRI